MNEALSIASSEYPGASIYICIRLATCPVSFKKDSDSGCKEGSSLKAKN